METFDRRIPTPNIERNRVLSDNYTCEIIAPSLNTIINLADLGLKSISWEARDEIKAWTPPTRNEEICIIKHKGFDFDLRWSKNAPDLMSMLIDQHTAYYNGLVLTKGNSGLNSLPNIDYGFRTNYQSMGANLRTDVKDRGNQRLSNNEARQAFFFGKTIDQKIPAVVSAFNQSNKKIPTNYVTPRYDLRIAITYPNYKKETEVYTFKNVAFYKPTQKTEENSAEIEESCKAFASWVEKSGQISVNPSIQNLVHDLLLIQMEKLPEESTINYHHRKIINPDLTNLNK